jgi:tetratricopeptide (TPR) repeat protein
MLGLATVYSESDQIAKALETLRSAVRLEPGSRESRYQLAETYRRMGDNDGYDYQMQIFRILETDSSVFRGGMERRDEIDLLHREIRMNPLFGRTRADRQLALRYAEVGDIENKELYSDRARASAIKEEMAGAVHASRQLMQLDSSAESTTQFHEINELRKRVVTALNRLTGYDSARSADQEGIGRSALGAGDYDDALVAFKAALLSNPDNAAAYRGLAGLYTSAGLGLGPARALANKAVFIDQSSESYAILAEINGAVGDR